MDRATPMPAEKEGTPRISPAASIRWSGLLAIVAGAYMLLLPFVHPSDEVGVRSAAWVPVHLLYFAALTITLLVLVGIFARQLQQAGRLGVAGFLTAFAGTAMLLLGGGSTSSPRFRCGDAARAVGADRRQPGVQRRLYLSWYRDRLGWRAAAGCRHPAGLWRTRSRVRAADRGSGGDRPRSRAV